VNIESVPLDECVHWTLLVISYMPTHTRP